MHELSPGYQREESGRLYITTATVTTRRQQYLFRNVTDVHARARSAHRQYVWFVRYRRSCLLVQFRIKIAANVITERNVERNARPGRWRRAAKLDAAAAAAAAAVGSVHDVTNW